MQCVPEITIALSIEVIDRTGFIGSRANTPLQCLLAASSPFISSSMTLYGRLALRVILCLHTTPMCDPCAIMSNIKKIPCKCFYKCLGVTLVHVTHVWESV